MLVEKKRQHCCTLNKKKTGETTINLTIKKIEINKFRALINRQVYISMLVRTC